MRYLFAIMIVALSQILCVEIPQEEHLKIHLISNGVEVWTCENRNPSHMVSVRVIWNKQEIPTVYALDCPYEELDEIEGFFEFCRTKIDCSSDHVAVVAVGNCSNADLFSLIEAHFQQIPQYETDVTKAPIKIRTVHGAEDVYISLMYPMPLQQLKELDDLRHQWVIYFLQNMIQDRLKKSLESLEEHKTDWVPHKEAHFLLPLRYCYGKVRCTEGKTVDVLAGLLRAVQKIKKDKFQEEELAALKAKAQKSLLSLNHRLPDNGTLATYFADQCAFGMGCPAYAFFMAHSQNIVADISLKDIHELAQTYLLDERRRVEIVGDPADILRDDEIQEVLALCAADSVILELDEDEEVLVEPVKEASNAYTLLPITDKEADIIRKIVETIAENNPIALGFKKSDLEAKGKKINHVHPLRFLGTVISNPDLKACLKEIRTSYFKWWGFMDGLSNRLEQEYARNNLLPYVAGFAKALNANPDTVRSYIQKKDWEGLVKYLLKVD